MTDTNDIITVKINGYMVKAVYLGQNLNKYTNKPEHFVWLPDEKRGVFVNEKQILEEIK